MFFPTLAINGKVYLGGVDSARQARERAIFRSSANNSGCSSAAKWPPAGNSLQRFTSYTRSIHDRGGESASSGKRGNAHGVGRRSPAAKRSGVFDDSR